MKSIIGCCMGSLTAQWWKELHDTDMTRPNRFRSVGPHACMVWIPEKLVTEKKTRPPRRSE